MNKLELVGLAAVCYMQLLALVYSIKIDTTVYMSILVLSLLFVDVPIISKEEDKQKGFFQYKPKEIFA